jgi:hypothetical protein
MEGLLSVIRTQLLDYLCSVSWVVPIVSPTWPTSPTSPPLSQLADCAAQAIGCRKVTSG